MCIRFKIRLVRKDDSEDAAASNRSKGKDGSANNTRINGGCRGDIGRVLLILAGTSKSLVIDRHLSIRPGRSKGCPELIAALSEDTLRACGAKRVCTCTFYGPVSSVGVGSLARDVRALSSRPRLLASGSRV